jgi:hypothetical protein
VYATLCLASSFLRIPQSRASKLRSQAMNFN